MKVHIVACGIFQLELERVLEEIKAEWGPTDEFNVTFTSSALHVDSDKLKAGITEALDFVTEEKKVLFFGSMCHPDLSEFTERYHVSKQKPRNCIDLILGMDRLKESESSLNVFYLTPGWLHNWQSIFKQGQGWDEIDARQNFGFYDKVVLLDTGVSDLKEEDILEFFEYTQVPIEIERVELGAFKEYVVETLKQALV
ncbi:DUF1638 domain-containing protein [Desulfosporosinus sp. FKB]|uniref:DUF1638 domain-containing protein n=1 Tax=Desulfosporosinus sp. FKB TaxID=1969835 RepID=UPI000B498231|nr:DUF1638 domain-containing protein [Desulfosporosinus sp. FKB]